MADVNPTVSCMRGAASAGFGTAPEEKGLSIAPIAATTPAECTQSGNRRPGFFPTSGRLRPAWPKSNETERMPGLRRRKSAGPVPIAARLFHGTRRSVLRAAVISRVTLTGFPAGRSWCADWYSPWRTGRGRQNCRRRRPGADHGTDRHGRDVRDEFEICHFPAMIICAAGSRRMPSIGITGKTSAIVGVMDRQGRQACPEASILLNQTRATVDCRKMHLLRKITATLREIRASFIPVEGPRQSEVLFPDAPGGMAVSCRALRYGFAATGSP